MNNDNPYVAPDADLGDAQIDEYCDVSFFSFSGRLGRIRYLAYSFLGYLISMIIMAIAVAAGSGNSDISSVIVIIGYIVMLVFMVALGIRRLHDFGAPGWVIVILFVPVVNMVLGLMLLILPGSDGANRYGNKTPPNTVILTIFGCILPIVFIVGIIAAIAIPAYKSYQDRATHKQRMLED